MTAGLEGERREKESAESNSDVILKAAHLVKEFDGLRAVDDVSLEVRVGEVVSLVGPNGAGKSTVCELICGSLSGAGEIWLDGARIDSLPAWRRAQSGLVRTFQRSSEFPRLTVLENLLVASELVNWTQLRWALAERRRWKLVESRETERAFELLGQFDLSGLAHRLAGELSGGQRRIVEIARALMRRPRVLVLDEPLAGLNEGMSLEVLSHIARCKAQGVAILLVEHNVDVITKVSDRIVAMSDGRVIASGDAAVVMNDPEVVDVYLRG